MGVGIGLASTVTLTMGGPLTVPLLLEVNRRSAMRLEAHNCGTDKNTEKGHGWDSLSAMFRRRPWRRLPVLLLKECPDHSACHNANNDHQGDKEAYGPIRHDSP